MDDYSRKVFLSPINKKSEVFGEFQKFKSMVENQTSQKIKIFRSDNGTEYINEQFQKLLSKCGIVHQKTAPYTPEQNGVAERLNRTIIDRVRCMLIDSGLDEKFWAEAAVTAAYLLNRIPAETTQFVRKNCGWVKDQAFIIFVSLDVRRLYTFLR